MIKKVLKNRMFLIIITIILTAGTTVFATIVYNANQIGYTPSDSTWNVNNVDTALNDLYNIQKNNSLKVYSLGTGTSFDIKTLYPEIDYTKITEDNFIVGATSLSAGTPMLAKVGSWVGSQVSISVNVNTSKSYDASSGILTVSSSGSLTCGDAAGGWSSGKISSGASAWLVLGTIE